MTREIKTNDIEKARRQIDLLNDPNYGVVLCFLDQFRSVLDLPNYPLQLFEDHLINYQEKIPARLIDLHFILLKRISLAKNAQREKFDSIITKFASRFDINDSEQLTTTGYLQSNIQIKIRILKNLLEIQWDLNQTFRNSIMNKSSREMKSVPFGRDRFGVSYWFFMDNHCFVRLFREDVDIDRTWTIVAKNRDELEKFIKVLITDFVVRKKFLDWTIDYETFSSLPSSNEFEQYYSPISVNLTETETETEITPMEGENAEVPMKKKRGRPKRSTKLVSNEIDVTMKKEEKEIESMSNHDEKPDLPAKRKRGRPKGSGKSSIKKEEKQIITRSRGKRISSVTENDNDQKFKINEDQSEHDETSMDDISLAIRCSTRFRKTSMIKSPPNTISQSSDAKKKRSKNPPRHRRRRTTSSSDEHMDDPSEDEYNSDDYLPNSSELDTIDANFFALDDEDNNTTNEQLRTAKTAQTSTIVTTCCVCFKSDRPEVLLLCDDCDDAYHLECLRPILLSVPDGDWFCPLCEHQKFSNNLIEKFQELSMNSKTTEMKQISSKSLKRKMKIKEYSSDESIPASESEHDNDEESMLSIGQRNENSHLSLSSCTDENANNNISQRGRPRRTRFDIKQVLHNHNSDSNDEEDDDRQMTNFDLQLPTKITRLLHRRDRSERQIKTSLTRFSRTSVDPNELNEKLDSPVVYSESDGKSIITNSKQTSQIVRRWNDVQRRSRMKAAMLKICNETITSDYADENSNHCHDNTSTPHSNDDNERKHEDNPLHHSKINLISLDKYSLGNVGKKVDANFDQLTRDIQFAVSEAHLLPTTKINNQQHVKRIPKKMFSPYLTKFPLSSKPFSDVYNIFKLKDSSGSSSTDLSNIILTPASSSSSLDANDDQTIQIMNS